MMSSSRSSSRGISSTKRHRSRHRTAAGEQGRRSPMGVCSQCQHFRRVKPASQLLAKIFPTTDADISHALNKIVEDEDKQRDEESQYKRTQATAGKSAWACRPVMSDYCGLNE